MSGSNDASRDLIAIVERFGADKESAGMKSFVFSQLGDETLVDATACDQSIAVLSSLKAAVGAADLPEDAKSHWANTVEWAIDVCEERRGGATVAG